MHKIFTQVIARVTKISTPISVSSLIISILYGLYRSVLKFSDFSLLGRGEVFVLVDKIVTYLFVLALVGLVLGSTTYVLAKTPLLKRVRNGQGKKIWKTTDPYEYLKWEGVWEIKDIEGKRVEYTRNATVRFLLPNVHTITDRIWGDGETMHDYRCSLGVPADVFDYGSSKKVVISFRENMNKGGVKRYTIARNILNGFTKAEEWIEEEPFYFVKAYTLRVIFPRERPCRRAVVSRKHPYLTKEVGERAFCRLNDGRQELRIRLKNVRRERIILRWWW